MSNELATEAARTSAAGPARRAGRPQLQAERAAQIVDAFIELVAGAGLERVTLDDVARASGVGRPAMRHFVGNREQLITAAIFELGRRYIRTIREQAGRAPTITALIDLFFSPEWTSGQTSQDAAFDHLHSQAMLHPDTRQAVRDGYDVLMGEIMSALRRSYPDAALGRVRDAAYVIACLVEYNIAFQQLGYPQARSRAARAAALAAAEQLAGK